MPPPKLHALLISFPLFDFTCKEEIIVVWGGGIQKFFCFYFEWASKNLISRLIRFGSVKDLIQSNSIRLDKVRVCVDKKIVILLIRALDEGGKMIRK